MFKFVNLEVQGGIAFLTLCNPPANAIIVELLRDLQRCLKEMEMIDTIKAMVLLSKSELTFATNDMTNGKTEYMTNRNLINEIIREIKDLTIPSIAYISGFALDDGFELALACDYRVSTKSARFGFLHGTVLSQPFLTTLMIGDELAGDVIEPGKIYGGFEAKRMGVVDRLISSPPIITNGKDLETFFTTQLGKVITSRNNFRQSV